MCAPSPKEKQKNNDPFLANPPLSQWVSPLPFARMNLGEWCLLTITPPTPGTGLKSFGKWMGLHVASEPSGSCPVPSFRMMLTPTRREGCRMLSGYRTPSTVTISPRFPKGKSPPDTSQEKQQNKFILLSILLISQSRTRLDPSLQPRPLRWPQSHPQGPTATPRAVRGARGSRGGDSMGRWCRQPVAAGGDMVLPGDRAGGDGN